MAQEKEDTPATPVILPPYTIDPFTTAKEDIGSWATAQADAGGGLKDSPAGPLSVKAFTMRLVDMIDMINELRSYNNPLCKPIPYDDPTTDPAINGIRFYLGMKDNPNPDINPKGSEKIPCLVFVPVSGFENGVTPGIPPTGGEDVVVMYSKAGGTVSACYDFTFPCPDTCGDSRSELYKATLIKNKK